MTSDAPARDFSRYLEDAAGHAGVPTGTLLHILPDDGQPPPAPVERAQTAAGLQSSWFGTATWDYLMHRLPHGIPWTEYPIVRSPSWMPRRNHRVLIRDASSGNAMPAGIELGLALDEVACVFLHLHPGWTREQEADHMLPMIDVLSRHPRVTRIFVGAGDGFETCALADLRDRYAWRLPVLRFDYNYRVNFRAIASKALLHALRTSPPHRDPAASSGSHWATPEQVLQARIAQIESGHYRGIDDPMLLQVLYRLRRHGSLPMAEADREAVFRLHDGEYFWYGSGAHPAARMDRMAVLNVFAMPGARNILISWCDKGFQLTAAGESFLALLHPGMEDPDLLCRWAGRDLTQKDADAMDAWLVGKFRKAKTRVNLIGKPA